MSVFTEREANTNVLVVKLIRDLDDFMFKNPCAIDIRYRYSPPTIPTDCDRIYICVPRFLSPSDVHEVMNFIIEHKLNRSKLTFVGFHVSGFSREVIKKFAPKSQFIGI